MSRVKDIVGERFGRLFVIERVGLDKRNSMLWRCLCDCGKETVVVGWRLRGCDTRSCGCYHRDRAREGIVSRSEKHGFDKRGQRNSEYEAWSTLRKRCENSKCAKYPRYGGRGIKVCERWHDFRNFIEDMGLKSGPGYSIDRINNDGNYEPGNCRWATLKEQARNRSNNRMLTCRGKTQCLSAWVEESGVTLSTLKHRLERGWDIERALGLEE